MRKSLGVLGGVLLMGCHSETTPKKDPTGTGGATTSATSTNAAASTNAATSTSASTTSSGPATYTAGSRLKIRTLTAEDGATEQRGWYDSQRQQSCDFQLAADGATRCLGVADAIFGQTYTDAQCTVPILALSKPCPPTSPKIARAYNTLAGCGPEIVSVFTVGALLAPPSALFTKSGMTCTDSTAIIGSFVYFALGAEVPPASFVAGTEAVKP